MRDKTSAIIGLTSEWCRANLDEECADLCRRLAAMLARKRPSPLARGDVDVWAAGVIYTVAADNFLFDRGSDLQISPSTLESVTGVPKKTLGSKARAIRQALDLSNYDPRLSRRVLLERHPYAWYVELRNGLIVDARTLPEEVQAEARRRGLIPDLTGSESARTE
jgi:hypothetical protein